MSEESFLIEDLAKLSSDPYAFVQWAFPWGEPDSELAGRLGPEPWQETLLKKIRDGLLTPEDAIQIAVASGHGIGKSAFVAWILLWGISTYEDARGVVTANTENQLKTKTWVELNKWHRLFIAKSLFEVTATKLCSRDPAHADTWRIDIVPWSERNTEAFAGMHNKGKRIIVVFDEGSAIPDIIFETTEGALTDSDTQIIWLICGNPTRNTGRFKECFPGGKFAHRWESIQVDSRDVSITNKKQIDRWIKDYGEDSDFVRIRVRGVFPRAGSLQFIPGDIVDQATQRELFIHLHDPFIIGVDVARFGDDSSVIYFRKGRDGRSVAPIMLRNVDTMTLAGRVSQAYLQYRADAVFVDGGGVGGGVVDRLRQLQVPVWDIQFGGKSDQLRTEGDGTLYANKRAEMWGSGKEWLKAGGCIPDDPQLKAELIGPEYGFNSRNEIQLERKEDMKKRGLSSPDIADALMITFAYPVIPHSLTGREGIQEPRFESEYNPFDRALELT